VFDILLDLCNIERDKIYEKDRKKWLNLMTYNSKCNVDDACVNRDVDRCLILIA
jgi:hypothetical protein